MIPHSPIERDVSGRGPAERAALETSAMQYQTLPGTNSGGGRVKIPYSALQYLFALADAFLIASAAVVGGGLYQLVTIGEFRNADQLLGAGLTAALLYVLIGQSGGFYDLRIAFSKRRRDAGRIFAQWSMVLWSRFGRDFCSLADLLKVPIYVLAKIPLYLKFILNRQRVWVRTDRDSR